MENAGDVVDAKDEGRTRPSCVDELTRWVDFHLLALRQGQQRQRHRSPQPRMAGGCKRQVVRSDGETAM